MAVGLNHEAENIPQHEKLSLGEYCGVVAIYSPDNLAPLYTTSALMALQHRGTNGAGETAYKNGKLKTITGMGRIVDVLTQDALAKLGTAKSALAHTRYATTGRVVPENAQPFTMSDGTYSLSLGHNGNLINADTLQKKLRHPIEATSDTAYQTALLLQERPKYASWEETLVHELPKAIGAFSSVMATESGEIFAFRDNRGIRPLHLGRLKEGGWIVASESVALDAINAEYMRPVVPGEIIHIDKNGKLSSTFFGEAAQKAKCALESIYFSRPDSLSDNGVLYEDGREESGRRLARRMKAKGIQPDVVVPVLNSGYPAGKGVAKEYGKETTDAIKTNPNYAQRTFILEDQQQRVVSVNGKHNVLPGKLRKKKVAIIDDSIVRKTTATGLAVKVDDADPERADIGAASPPVVDVCDLGVDMPTKGELGASPFAGEPLDKIEEKMAKKIGVDSVTYLPIEDVAKSFDTTPDKMCYHCFGGQHPIRDGHPIFRERKKSLEGKPKIAILISGEGTNMEQIAKEIASGTMDAKIVEVISNNPNAGGIKKAKNLGIPVSIISSQGRLKDLSQRNLFEQEIADRIALTKADIVVLAGWKLIMGDKFLQQMQKREIPVINIHPALLTAKNESEVRTSRGKIPVLRGLGAMEKAYEEQLPVSGITVHQVLPESTYDIGPILLKEEVRRRRGETLESWEERMRSTEHRVLPTALKRLIHMMKQGIDVSHGDFSW